MILESRLSHFLPYIEQLDKQVALQKQDLLNETFLLKNEGMLNMYYAPHNDYINTNAKIAIVGITPGWSQMRTAYHSIIHSLQTHEKIKNMLQNAKNAAGFSGVIRQNLIDMLDHIGLAEMLEVSSSAQLFSMNRDLLHTTSIIRYPVFINGQNYSGYSPTMKQSPLLSQYAFNLFPKELEQMKSSTLVIPLGNAVEKVLREIIEHTSSRTHTYLFGFPHPSEANGHRKRQLQQNKLQLQRMLGEWINRQD